MFVTADIPTPPVQAVATAAVIDENWAARTVSPPAAKSSAIAPVKPGTVDPRIAAGVAAVLADTPAHDPAPNRQAGLQNAVYGRDAVAVEKFAQGFSEARKSACLSPATGGLGLLAIPLIAVQAIRGKCSMP
jgi:hypothetical protein